MSDTHPVTRVIRAGIGQDGPARDVVAPVHLSTTFVTPRLGDTPEFDYSRSNNPTRSLLARAVADLEGGFGAVITASGMAAITTVVEAFVPGGGVVVAPVDCYGGTWRLLDAQAGQGRLNLRLVELSDLDAARQAITPDVDLVLIESPTNPLLRVTDIAAVAELAHAVGALVVADNTFASPLGQQPLKLGADVVVHSATKYLAGHSDVVLGAIVSGGARVQQETAWWANCLGLTAGPIDAYLGLRGLRTLHLRFEAAQRSAQAVAELLDQHPAVARVHYPGLPAHPGHALARRQQTGFGAIVSFELADLAQVEAFLPRLRRFALAESLGGVESLVSHTATMTHAAMTPEARAAAGLGDGLL
ncbi:MAG: PLP-dependent aspartate aminotransferase family protein, partial [Propionibacteriaceae bacterium]|nr:PLP-dependent aspartate aminotransferase family protein [Propionibacteriaceae bacterium]